LSGHDPGVFNFTGVEIVVLGLLALIFLGTKRIPQMIASRPERPIASPHWSWSEWTLVCAALLSVVIALALLVGPSP
jgi:protein-S-isoprenylcysteine O-methyltransferase Ste14